MVNVELLRRTLEYIETHPEEWDQETWGCGTVACFAGHAVALSGNWEEAYKGRSTLVIPAGSSRKATPYSDNIITTYKSTAARLELGLSMHQSDLLFQGSNTLARLRHYVHRFIEEENNT